MMQQELDAQGVSLVEVFAEGTVAIAAWERETLSAVGGGDASEPEGVRIEQGNGTARVQATDDLRLLVPRRVRVRLARVRGDARATGLQGGLEAQELVGDLRVHDMLSDVQAAQVSGDLKAAHVLGSVRSATVAGDLQVLLYQ